MENVKPVSDEHGNEPGRHRTHRSSKNNETISVKTAPRGYESRRASTVHSWQTSSTKTSPSTDTLIHFIPHIRTCGKAAKHSTTAVIRRAPHEYDAAVPSYDTHISRGRLETTVFRSSQTIVPDVWNFRSRGQHWTIRADRDTLVWFQNRGRGRASERISGIGEAIR